MRLRSGRFAVLCITLLGFGALAGIACGGEGAGEVEGGGEAPLAAFTAGNLSLKYPSTWTKTSDSPLTFTGQDEFLIVDVRPSSGATPAAAANQDLASLASSTPDFKQKSLGASTEVKNATVLSYEWTLPKSAVTGKPVPQRADRYYIDVGNGRLAVVSGSSPTSRFDREQVRDIALTVKVAP